MMSSTSKPAGRLVVRDPGGGCSADVDTVGMERIRFDFSESDGTFNLTDGDDTLEISLSGGGLIRLLHFGQDGAAQIIELVDGTCVPCAELLRVFRITDEDCALQRG